MSKSKHPYDDFEEEMERMLESLSEALDEEDFGYFSPTSSRGVPYFGSDLDDEGDTPPPVPKEAQCGHKRWKKVDMTYSSFYLCEDCKKDLGNKAPKNENN